MLHGVPYIVLGPIKINDSNGKVGALKNN
jgi:hypothetical protein